MANHTKFVSVNLNKSYGKPHPTSSSSSSSSYASRYVNGGLGSRGRSSSGGGGGGMVVLSRPRSSGQKAPSRLAVPPPLNLPSLRKEHERKDTLTGSGLQSGVGISGVGSAHGGSGMGWTKPVVVQPVPLEKNEGRGVQGISDSRDKMNGMSDCGSQLVTSVGLGRSLTEMEKVEVLKGEDFPSLLATLPSSQRTPSNQKPNHKVSVEEFNDRDSPPLLQPSSLSSSQKGLGEERDMDLFPSSGGTKQPTTMAGLYQSPLTTVQLSHTSDWADDERDTSHRILDRGRDKGFSRTDCGWGHGYPSASGRNYSKVSSAAPSKEYFIADSFSRDSSIQGRESRSWRGSLLHNDGISARGNGVERGISGSSKCNSLFKDNNRDIGRHDEFPYAENVRDANCNAAQDSWYQRRDLSFGQNIQIGKNSPAQFNVRNSQKNENVNDRYGDTYSKRHRINDFHEEFGSRSQHSFGNKGVSFNESPSSFFRNKHFLPCSGKLYMEDANFDSSDRYSGNFNFNVLRRKKDTLKNVDFHDPARESFEAELERVQRMQEEERQRILEEQAHALELAKKEEQERDRMVREEVEMRQRLEDEAREAAWREEYVRLEALRKDEEQKIAREEEKKYFLMEEDRRKEAARRKLLELEARMEKRQAEKAERDIVSPADAHDDQATREVEEEERRKEGARLKLLELEARMGKRQVIAETKVIESPADQTSEMAKESAMCKTDDGGDWDDGERLVERITSSVSSDSSSLNRGFEIGSRPRSSRNENSYFTERSKHPNFCKKDSYNNTHNSTIRGNGYYSSQQDVSGKGRILLKKVFFNGPEPATMRPLSKDGVLDFHHTRGHGWGVSRSSEQNHGNSDFDNSFCDNEGYIGIGWGQTHARGGTRATFSDSIFPNSDADGFETLRSRHVMRQPRVPPPPSSFSNVQRNNFSADSECNSSQSYLRSAHRNEVKTTKDSYGSDSRERTSWQQGTVSVSPNNENNEQHERNISQRGSQSSVSVSSEPSSPTHLFHTSLDEYGDFCSVPVSASGIQIPASDDVHTVALLEARNTQVMPDSISHTDEDEWTIENNAEMHDLEEFVDVNQVEEVCQDDCENSGMAQEIKDTHLEKQNGKMEMDQVVIKFNEGVNVNISCSDQLERSSCGDDNNDTHMVSDSTTLDIASFDGALDGSGSDLHAKDSNFSDVPVRISDMIKDAEKSLQNMVVEPDASSYGPLGSLDTFVSSEVSAAQPVTSAIQTQSLPVHSIFSSVSSVPSQTDKHMEVQFGLFSGPSLIPSPVPAIQIGSIQTPLHLHDPVSTSISHMHSSHPSLFQFRKLHYTSSTSQGILPLTQNMPFNQSSFSPQHTFYKNIGSIPHNNMIPYSSTPMQNKKNEIGNSNKSFDASQEKFESKLLHGHPHGKVLELQDPTSMSYHGDDGKIKIRESQNTPINDSSPSNNSSGLMSTERGKRYIYTVKNSGIRSHIPRIDTSQKDHNNMKRKTQKNIRRTEFRVRESGSRRYESQPKFDYTNQSLRRDTNAGSGGSGRMTSRRDIYLSRHGKFAAGSTNTSAGTLGPGSFNSEKRVKGKEAMSKKIASPTNGSQSRNRRLKSNVNFEDVVDAPLQSGVVQIFKQPGIEIPSDEDDFIEVRSKRKMLNDRREQKEKEIKAKYRVARNQIVKKQRYFSQGNMAVPNVNMVNICNENLSNDVPCPVIDRIAAVSLSPSTICSTDMLHELLHPVGTPSVKSASDVCLMDNKTTKINFDPVIASDGLKHIPGKVSDDRCSVFCNLTTVDSWENGHVNQEVMTLTQTQLDDAMKPAHFDAQPTSIVNSDTVDKQGISSTSVTLNSLLYGEKIQFGAITPPSVLPPVVRAVNKVSVHPDSASCRPSLQVDDNLSAPELDSHQLEDQEAEAAASAVASISNDEVIESCLGASSASALEKKNKGSGGEDVVVLTSGGSLNIEEVSKQSTTEEFLNVTLPADLSVEPSSMSLWPNFPSSETSSGPLLSYHTGDLPPHFPCFDMNSMLSGPVFAFGSHTESSGSQSQPQPQPQAQSQPQPQPQKRNLPGSGSVGAWPQYHSSVESYYGHPTGFPGPFINSQAGVPRIQGPPQMIFYNPFSPVGQYSLNFMGATAYVPPGKQPDWKHNPISSITSLSDSDVNNSNAVSGQRTLANISQPIQHLGQVAPLVPVASHVPMYDMPPFQSSSDIPVQARWPHIPISLVNNIPMAVQMDHSHTNGGMASQNDCSMQTDLSTEKNRFPESRSLATTDCNRKFTIPTDPVVPFHREVDPSCSSSCLQPRKHFYGSSSGNSSKGSGGSINLGGNGGSSSESVGVKVSSSNSKSTAGTKPSRTISSSKKHLHPIGHSDHRARLAFPHGGGSGNEWHRRTGSRGRNHHILGSDKNVYSSKVKQVYVAKHPASGSAT